ncbi:MAG: 1-acyl-sn-glycerol-3-phosphate acyltransferase [Actinobacteria bacterium]|nr:1-acyl-sn-glycerol-3-phosphate acyltransferase [Actinomycetota bacterium]MBU1944760.1 1-acyl-sn-glycerol-3-phosphate acyltransferase [Actinomycetota bacterium]MBU2688851.1 1-acyl-sn-glycerol-3-phosphate acyltransferase [Actinomycetota bacterium]
MVLIEALRLTFGPLLGWHFRVRTEGADNVPEDGGGVIVSNHRSYSDPLIMGYAIERYINFAAGSHLYGVPGTAPLMNLAGFFSMDIYGGDAGDRSLDTASRLLANGELVGIFPEGIESFMHVNAVSKVSSFKTGFAKLALENRVPIIPVAIAPETEKGLLKIPGVLVTPFVRHPRAREGVDLITYRRVTLRIGRPIDLSAYHDEVFSKDLIDRVAAKVRRIVIKLYDGEDLDRFLTGEKRFDFARERV